MFASPNYYALRVAPSPRDTYLAAVAQAKATEEEFLAAERLQQEENALRHRLEQIQLLKQPEPFYRPRYEATSAYPRPLPYAAAASYQSQPPVDADALRRQIAAEERERILREQEQERRHKEQVKALESRYRERERALAAREAEVAALARRVQKPFVNQTNAPAKPRAVSPEQLFGPQIAALVREEDPSRAPEAEISAEDIIRDLFGRKSAVPESKKAAPPAPKPKAAPSKPTAAPSHRYIELGQLLNHLTAQQIQQRRQNAAFCRPAHQPKAESSKAASSKSIEKKLKEDLEARLRASVDQDIAETIRLSLANLNGRTNTAKGKEPAPAPVKNTTTSAAEIKEIDASFTALSNDWVVPEHLDFSTSRTTSPVRSAGAAEPDSVMARLTYSAQNQPVRYYHQALSKLLARLDAVESFGDEDVRHARKEVVGKVEGALDEVESVVEARWRKSVGREREQAEVVPAPEETDVIPPASEPDAAVVDNDALHEHPLDAVVEPLSDSVVEAATSAGSEPAETIQPYDAEPTVLPVTSEGDTFFLPAELTEEPGKTKKATVEEEVGSDWSEVDA